MNCKPPLDFWKVQLQGHNQNKTSKTPSSNEVLTSWGVLETPLIAI
jgi:hypothetical protein